jgi:transcription antitermination protein NusB
MATQKPSARARRSAARLAAVQALYQIDLTGAATETVVAEFARHRFGEPLDGDAMVSPDPPLFGDIVRGVGACKDEVDRLIEGAIESPWSLARLELPLRAALRAGAWELLANRATAPRIVISEYVDVARAFFGGKEPAMVNAVLDRLARALREDEMGAAAPAKT